MEAVSSEPDARAAAPAVLRFFVQAHGLYYLRDSVGCFCIRGMRAPISTLAASWLRRSDGFRRRSLCQATTASLDVRRQQRLFFFYSTWRWWFLMFSRPPPSPTIQTARCGWVTSPSLRSARYKWEVQPRPGPFGAGPASLAAVDLASKLITAAADQNAQQKCPKRRPRASLMA